MNIKRIVTWSPFSVIRPLLLLGVCLLTFVALVDPADQIFHVKVPAFAFVVLMFLLHRGLNGRYLSSAGMAALLSVAVLIPLLWSIPEIAHPGVHNPDAVFGTVKAFLFLFLLPVALLEDLDLSSLLIRMNWIIAALTFAMIGTSFFLPALFEILYGFSVEKHNAIITTSRDMLGVGVGMFYYKTSPLVLFSFSYYFSRAIFPGPRRLAALLAVIVFGATLLFSGARANFLCAVFVASILLMFAFARRAGWAIAFLFILAGTTAFAMTVVVKLANPAEASNTIKLLHVQSYEREFTDHPSSLLWGEGADTSFYSEGFRDWATDTELSYLELVRVYGVPITLAFLVCLALPLKSLFRTRRYDLLLAYIGYLFICGSNPLLISSTGFLAICGVWKEARGPSTAESAFHVPAPHFPAFHRSLPSLSAVFANRATALRRPERRSLSGTSGGNS